MNKKQTLNYGHLVNALEKHGISRAETDKLLKCERTVHRWAERECGDGSDWAIERDETTSKPYTVYHGPGNSRRFPIADLESGALKRASAIATVHGMTIYHQTDPRGCALYLIRPGDVPIGQCVTGYYSRGIAICY